MFNLGNVKFGLRDLDLTIGEDQGFFHGIATCANSTNTIGSKSHLSYLRDVLHPK
jgi:hypothetical protein